MGKALDMTGQQFGELSVIERAGTDKHRRALWLCHCSCGKDVIVPGEQLRTGSSKSCGHKQRNFFVENGYRTEATHGMSHTRLYKIWCSMKYRCLQKTSKDYPDYGGRGITIHQEWIDSFEAFRDWAVNNGYNDNLTIDREDVNGPYSPDNCRWISNTKQQDNKRTTKYITYDGTTRTINEWAVITGIPAKTLNGRLRHGWTVEKAITTPLVHGKRNYGPRIIEFNGKSQSVKEWADEYGLKEGTLIARLDRDHWPIEKAITTPARKRTIKAKETE